MIPILRLLSKYIVLFSCYLALGLPLVTIAQPQVVIVQGVRIWPSPGSVRVVFDLNTQANYKISTLAGPYRVVIDLENTKVNFDLKKLQLNNTNIKNVRVGFPKPKITRIVLETLKPFKPKSFLLKPNEKYGFRLVLDLESKEKQQILALFDLDQIDTVSKQTIRPGAVTKQLSSVSGGNFIIALDAGHGGEDPGAIGPLGTKEKDIALSIARSLKTLINQQRGFRAFLIRDGDYYVGLRERMQRARAQNADLFISIHADAYTNPRATGSSVFILSKRGASSEAAQWLAAKENRADLVGGVRLENKNNMLASVLLDLSQAANEDASLEAASHILKALSNITTLHKRYVERAGFAVLRAPDVPSILVETGFITNPTSERLLRSEPHRRKLAYNIMLGIKQYFAGKPLRQLPIAKPIIARATLNTKQRRPVVQVRSKVVAKKRSNIKAPQHNKIYIVRKGDTLSLIAVRNKVPIAKIRQLNKLKKDQVYVAQKLQLPTK